MPYPNGHSSQDLEDDCGWAERWSWVSEGPRPRHVYWGTYVDVASYLEEGLPVQRLRQLPVTPIRRLEREQFVPPMAADYGTFPTKHFTWPQRCTWCHARTVVVPACGPICHVRWRCDMWSDYGTSRVLVGMENMDAKYQSGV